jgi:uncharacterized membrane protein YgcG
VNPTGVRFRIKGEDSCLGSEEKMKIRLWMAVWVCMGLIFGARSSQAQAGKDTYSKVYEVPRQQINDWLKGEVTRSGGDWGKDRYAFLVGFSTGHYGQDPVHAIAMRRLAFSLLNNTLTAGDRVASFAWEMQAWDKSDYTPLTTDPQTRREFVEHVPYSPQQGSKGGHDTERALFDALTTAVPPEQANSTIILLLTNSNQSMGPTGEKRALFGKNNPKLAEAVAKLGYRTPPSRQSFTLKTEGRDLNVDITALFPKSLKSLPDAPDTPRYPTFARNSWQPQEDMPAESEKLPNAAAATGSGSGGGGGNGDGSGGGNGGGGGAGNGSGGGGGAGGSGANGANGSGATNTVAGAPGQDGKDGKDSGIPWWVWLILVLILLAVAAFAAKAMMKPKQPQPVTAVAAPAGKPLPGAIEVVIGAKSLTLQPLNTAQQWTLYREGDALAVFDPQAEMEKPERERRNPPALATLRFDDKRRLEVQAEPDTQFLELRGVNIADSNNRVLHVAAGERLFCRAAVAGMPTPARLELIYHAQRKA